MKLFLINRKKCLIFFLNHINNNSTSVKANDKMDRKCSLIDLVQNVGRQWESLDVQVCSIK